MSAALLDAHLRAALETCVLPGLQARDLAALAATCKGLKALIKQQPVELWKTAAASALWPKHPVLLDPSASAGQVRAALTARSEAQRNIRSGKFAFEPGWQCVKQLWPSPDGERVLLRKPSVEMHGKELHTATLQCEGTLPLANSALGFYDDCC